MTLTLDTADLLERLGQMGDADLDALGFGVIGFDSEETVLRYNLFESEAAGLAADRVIGRDLFEEVAPCTNNYLVAERFRAETSLDEQLDYVFTLRMRPTPVRLRLLAGPSAQYRYMLVGRLVAGDNEVGQGLIR